METGPPSSPSPSGASTTPPSLTYSSTSPPQTRLTTPTSTTSRPTSPSLPPSPSPEPETIQVVRAFRCNPRKPADTHCEVHFPHTITRASVLEEKHEIHTISGVPYIVVPWVGKCCVCFRKSMSAKEKQEGIQYRFKFAQTDPKAVADALEKHLKGLWDEREPEDMNARNTTWTQEDEKNGWARAFRWMDWRLFHKMRDRFVKGWLKRVKSNKEN